MMCFFGSHVTIGTIRHETIYHTLNNWRAALCPVLFAEGSAGEHWTKMSEKKVKMW